MKIPKLLQAVLVLAIVYYGFILVFDVILDHVIPSSLLTMYMFFVVAGVFMVFTATEDGTRELIAPIKALVEDPNKKMIRNVVFVILPLLAGWYTFEKTRLSFEAPVELRTIHPAPPTSMKAFNKRYDIIKLENPLRKLEKMDLKKYKEHVTAGAKVYIQNCHFCHGDKLDGKGPYAAGL
ncbi:MAG: cytochrome c, partial [Rhodospirillales bacterium]|nr:cytochrome c [Rhodospirillales bacterium]